MMLTSLDYATEALSYDALKINLEMVLWSVPEKVINLKEPANADCFVICFDWDKADSHQLLYSWILVCKQFNEQVLIHFMAYDSKTASKSGINFFKDSVNALFQKHNLKASRLHIFFENEAGKTSEGLVRKVIGELKEIDPDEHFSPTNDPKWVFKVVN